MANPHWSSAFVGRPYIDGEFDCGELARAVQREVFGREVRIPTERGYLGESHPVAKARAAAAQIAEEMERCVQRTDLPRDGDAVILVSSGYLQHIGVYCWIGTEPWVLHADNEYEQVVLTRIRDLGVSGLKVASYHRWI